MPNTPFTAPMAPPTPAPTAPPTTPADRAGDPVAFPGALLSAAYDALGMPELGHREQSEDDGCRRQKEFRRQTRPAMSQFWSSSSCEFLDARP